MVELEVNNNGPLEQAKFEVGDDLDDAAFEDERCVLCMDIIVDRGVLDCCQHWFCFACIDNWATITNVCPFCQEGFQLITCIPVYDTIQSSKVDDDSVLRDDDWCIQGNCNTLSFPSFYIDENAVVWMDGDACKIPNGQAAINDDLNLDTSIACDSCDLWYHAYCVGFVPETTSDNSWLCPSVPSQTSIKSCIESVPSESESSIDLHLGLSVRSSLSVETAINDATENQVSENVQQYNSAKRSLSVGKMEPLGNADIVRLTGKKRKCMSSM